MAESLSIGYLFVDARRFPWDVFGWGVPKVGQVHSYLASIMSEIADHNVRPFLSSRPTLRELNKASKIFESELIDSIVVYSQGCYDLPQSDRPDVAAEVLLFLSRRQEFRAFVQKKLDSLYRQGLITMRNSHA